MAAHRARGRTQSENSYLYQLSHFHPSLSLLYYMLSLFSVFIQPLPVTERYPSSCPVPYPQGQRPPRPHPTHLANDSSLEQPAFSPQTASPVPSSIPILRPPHDHPTRRPRTLSTRSKRGSKPPVSHSRFFVVSRPQMYTLSPT